jgi:F-type H+-transporting ATPase subunit delta
MAEGFLSRFRKQGDDKPSSEPQSAPTDPPPASPPPAEPTPPEAAAAPPEASASPQPPTPDPAEPASAAQPDDAGGPAAQPDLDSPVATPDTTAAPTSPATVLARSGDPDERAAAEVYAYAVKDLAASAGQLDAAADEARELLELLGEQPDVVKLLKHPNVAENDRRDVIDRVFRGQVSDRLLRTLHVLHRHGRLGLLPDMLHSLIDLVHNRLDVTATTARPLDDDQAQQLQDRLSQATGQKVELTREIDESLIAGLKLRVGDNVLDGSAKTRLERVRRKLKDQGRERAREQADIAEPLTVDLNI